MSERDDEHAAITASDNHRLEPATLIVEKCTLAVGVALSPDGDDMALDLSLELARVREHIIAAVPPTWGATGELIRSLVVEPLPAFATLPIAACAAAGGAPSAAIPLAAAWHLTGVAVRILDDISDDDHADAVHRRIGVGRAATLAATFLELAQGRLACIAAPPAAAAVRALHHDAALAMWSAQDRDVAVPVTTHADYHALVHGKTAVGFGYALEAGVVVGGGDEGAQRLARDAGCHLGVMLQLLDDLETCLLLRPGDLGQGKLTYPLWIAIEAGGDRAAALRVIVDAGEVAARADEVRAILRGAEIAPRVVAAALAQRDQAKRAIERLPGRDGVAALVAFLDWSLRDAERLLGA